MIFRSLRPGVDIPNLTLTQLALGSAAARASETALVDGPTGRALTYGELLERVRRTAAGLWALGIRPRDVVALYAPNMPEYAVAFHAVASIGAIVLPANPAGTSQDLAFQLTDSGAKLLVTTADLDAKARAAIQASGRPIELLAIDETAGARSLRAIERDAEPPAVEIDPAEDVVVLPYSSGTTGLPKGVMLTHRNVVANVLQIDAAEQGEVRAFVGVLPFFHIYGLVVVLSVGLMRGALIVTLPRFELDPFLKVLQDWRIELAHIVPPIALLLARHPAVDAYRLNLKWLVSGAAPLSADVEQAVGRRLGATLRQGYGMTEASPVTHYTGLAEHRPGKVGQLVAGTECRVVDPENGRGLGAGEPGEIWVRGPQVMKGYLNNPDATARTLVEDGWLRTGDIGIVDADGYLTIVDRLKELIKFKGFQVAPAELEALLLTHPQIADAAVIPVPDDEAGEVPKAFVVARGPLTAAEVIAFVEGKVAHYKRIRHAELVDAIPKSASGKILRRVLVERERAARQETFGKMTP
jgi:acyl-CoA synthetase (AMP-forming)/AMP-acid ligase II